MPSTNNIINENNQSSTTNTITDLPTETLLDIKLNKQLAIDEYGQETFEFSVNHFIEEEYNEHFERLNKAFENKEGFEFKSVVHTMKSTAKYLTAMNFADQCARFEQWSKPGYVTWEPIIKNFDILVENFKRVYDAVKVFYDELNNPDDIGKKEDEIINQKRDVSGGDTPKIIKKEIILEKIIEEELEKSPSFPKENKKPDLNTSNFKLSVSSISNSNTPNSHLTAGVNNTNSSNTNINNNVELRRDFTFNPNLHSSKKSFSIEKKGSNIGKALRNLENTISTNCNSLSHDTKKENIAPKETMTREEFLRN